MGAGHGQTDTGLRTYEAAEHCGSDADRAGEAGGAAAPQGFQGTEATAEAAAPQKSQGVEATAGAAVAQEPKASELQDLKGKLHRVRIASVSQTASGQEERQPVEESKPVTQEVLESLWEEMLRELPGIPAQHLKGLTLRIEEVDMFVVEVESNYAETEIKPHLLDILKYLRGRTNRQLLNCRIEIVAKEHDTVAYMPRDKYDIMLESNPALATMRVYFPEIDF